MLVTHVLQKMKRKLLKRQQERGESFYLLGALVFVLCASIAQPGRAAAL